MNNNNSWFHRIISINEMKVSSLVISFLVFSSIGVYILITKNDIPPNLTTFLLALAGIIGGVNCFNFVSNNMAMSRNNQQMPYQNTYGMNNMYGMGSNYPSTMPMTQSGVVQPNNGIAQPTNRPTI